VIPAPIRFTEDLTQYLLKSFLAKV